MGALVDLLKRLQVVFLHMPRLRSGAAQATLSTRTTSSTFWTRPPPTSRASSAPGGPTTRASPPTSTLRPTIACAPSGGARSVAEAPSCELLVGLRGERACCREREPAPYDATSLADDVAVACKGL